jgi:hypothetical protein
MRPLIDLINLTQAAGATGSTGVSTPVLDMDGYEGVLFLGYEETTNTSNQLVVRGGSASGSLSEYTGTSGGEASGTQVNLYLDVFRPKHRYIDACVNSSLGATGNCHLVAIRYGGRKLPATNATDWNGKALSSPNTGTATATG